jgi:F-type H+-transporting ATPase subunit b
MSLTATVFHFGARLISDSGVTVDGQGIVTHSPILPETSELIYGSIASILIFGVLIKFGGPAVKKALAARTAKIQKELDGAAGDKAAAATEAASIRQAKGDINAERDRLMAEAAAQGEIMVSEGNARIEEEVAELLARATTDIQTAKGRQSDELRAEISRLSSAAAERATAESIDDATHQQLIEAFIQNVGIQNVGIQKAGASA